MYNSLDIFEKKNNIDVMVSPETLSKNEEENTEFEGNEAEFLMIDHFLDSKGISRHLCGYNYLVYALIISLHSGNRKIFYTKEIYPLVAKHFNTGAAAVERSIRTAVRSGYMDNPVITKVPSNSTFISEAVSFLRTKRLREILMIGYNN